jgi:hypothetical protein
MAAGIFEPMPLNNELSLSSAAKMAKLARQPEA